jgi:uncharacterized membrane protein SirB2
MRLDDLPPSSFVFVVVVMVMVVLVIDFILVAVLVVVELFLQAVSSDQVAARWWKLQPHMLACVDLVVFTFLQQKLPVVGTMYR